MGSLGLPRATRFETTTKFTGRPLLFIPACLTGVHQYGSCSSFQPIETKIGRVRWNRLLPEETRDSTAKTVCSSVAQQELCCAAELLRAALCLGAWRCLAFTSCRRAGARGMCARRLA